MTLTPHSSATPVVVLALTCGVIILSVTGCNLTNAAVQPVPIMLNASDTRLVLTTVPTFESAAPEMPVTEPAFTPSPLNPLDLPVSQFLQLNEEPLLPLSAPLEPLVDPELPLQSSPVQVQLQIRIPALRLTAPVLGVGLTPTNAMAAPVGRRSFDPIWWSVFWYRGGGIPGDVGTATIAGHFDDDLGRPAVFAFLAELEVGDLIYVDDARNGAEIPFIVTETETYTREESADPAILARIFGFSALGGAEAQSAPDLVSRLTLITCDGAWVNGSFDQHLVVFATRANYPPA